VDSSGRDYYRHLGMDEPFSQTEIISRQANYFINIVAGINSLSK
jgi:hypothetical protein